MEFIENLSRLFRREKSEMINPEDYGVHLGEFPIVSSGSKVYCGREKDGSVLVAFKVYDRTISEQIGLGEARRYQLIADKAKTFLDGEKVILPRNDDEKDEFVWVVNPIERVGKLPDTGETCSVSQFIEGPRLDEQISQGRYNSSTVNKVLKEISEKLNREMETKHISIVPINVKVNLAGLRLTVTDLYAQVRKLKEEKIV